LKFTARRKMIERGMPTLQISALSVRSGGSRDRDWILEKGTRGAGCLIFRVDVPGVEICYGYILFSGADMPET
jgi:hypothetical protein